MHDRTKATYFDSIAEQWDGWQHPSAHKRILAGLEHFCVGRNETVLDLGCGTGNLAQALLERLSPAGRILAFDISPRMLEIAKAKVTDARVVWTVADAHTLPLEAKSVDRIIAYSVWPHFHDPIAVVKELRRVLRSGGHLHVWHLLSRSRINEIHAHAADCIQNDMLSPADETARLLEDAGYTVLETKDDDSEYLVSAGVMAERTS